VDDQVDGQAAVGPGDVDSAPEPTCAGSIAGEFITETLTYDGGRKVTAYVPPDPPEAVVFAGDGQLITRWGGHLEAADVPPTMIVGAHRAGRCHGQDKILN
jgi:hypothetical protein